MEDTESHIPFYKQGSVILLTVALGAVVFLTFQLDDGGKYERAHEVNRSLSPHMLVEKGWTYFKNDPQTARMYFTKAYRMDRNLPESIDAMGRLALHEERYHDAVRYFQVLHKKHPKKISNWSNLAISLMGEGKMKEAEALALDGRLIFEEEQFVFDVILSCIYKRQERPKLADKYLRQAHKEKGDILLQVSRQKWAAPLLELKSFKELQGASRTQTGESPVQ